MSSFKLLFLLFLPFLSFHAASGALPRTRSHICKPRVLARIFHPSRTGVGRGAYPAIIDTRTLSRATTSKSDIDISVLWDDSKELPDVQEDFEEPPEWNIKEGEETIVSGLSSFLDGSEEEEEDDPFANENLTLENFNVVADGDTISDDLLDFDLAEFGILEDNAKTNTKDNNKNSNNPKSKKKDDDDKFFSQVEEHIADIETLSVSPAAVRVLQRAQRQADGINRLPGKGSQRIKRIMEAATGEAAAKVRSNPKMRQTHRKLRIVGGSKAKKLLLSPKDANVRPMMEKVRSAVFNLLSARFGGGALMPEGTRWLDMFGGTGAVGIEAISRGVEHATFVELDRWVVKTILKANIHACDFQDKAQVLNMKAEDFLKRSIDYPHYAGKPFDFISVCPPYQLVSYPELFDLLSRSPLVHSKTYILVEYPKQLKEEIPDQITTVLGGVLPKFRDRSYGRTWLAVYGPTESDSVRINPNRYDDKIVGKSSGEDKNEHGGEQSPDTSNGDDRSA